jgi:hypothetical protein
VADEPQDEPQVEAALDAGTRPAAPEEQSTEARRQLFRGIAMPGLNFGALGGALFPRLRRKDEDG